VVRGTTNLAPCCHLANDTDLLTPVLWDMAGDNKKLDLWPADPFTRMDPKFNQERSIPSLKISCKSVQPFSRNVADKETEKERKKSPENKTPSPYRGRGKDRFIMLVSPHYENRLVNQLVVDCSRRLLVHVQLHIRDRPSPVCCIHHHHHQNFKFWPLTWAALKRYLKVSKIKQKSK